MPTTKPTVGVIAGNAFTSLLSNPTHVEIETTVRRAFGGHSLAHKRCVGLEPSRPSQSARAVAVPRDAFLDVQTLQSATGGAH
ncbi:hypothetical protein [Nocardioides marmoriginsengisoli]|uniref:hypothetical protein n=1 Tax=Nocardioides marmoriginsengisoli TaxID=661483 RepID=UPI0011CDF631|nr:hypothetical protein [Nocardioides marmoriginsengisoli]